LICIVLRATAARIDVSGFSGVKPLPFLYDPLNATPLVAPPLRERRTKNSF
jgi:hypothetical protein